MKITKNKVTAAGVASLMLVGATGVTLAYLSDGEKAKNTFTFGDVTVETEEPNWPGNDDPKPKVPNDEVKKDPQMVNTGKTDAIAVMTVDSPLAKITTIKDDGTELAPKGVTELFYFKQTAQGIEDHTTSFNTTDWQELTTLTKYFKIKTDNSEEEIAPGNVETTFNALAPGEKMVKRYVFGYKTQIQGSADDGTPQTPANKRTKALFDKVQVKNYANGEVDSTPKDVIVRSYAIQGSSVSDGSGDLTQTLDETNLTKIFNITLAGNTNLRDVDDVTNGHTNRWGTTDDVTSPGQNLKP